MIPEDQGRLGSIEIAQDTMVLTLLSPAPTLSSACFLSVEKLQPKNKFDQRSEKMQKENGPTALNNKFSH